MAKAVRQLMDKWINDPSFRSKMKSDPEGAVSAAGINLSKDEKAALANVDWSLSDEELQVRASKANPL